MYYSNGTRSSEEVDYENTSSLDSQLLIMEIKKRPILYDHGREDYTNHLAKEAVWEEIYETMFPRYHSLPIETQTVIKNTVRRRWKTLRSAMSKDVKNRITNKHYRQSENPFLKNMQFLLPFIKSIYAQVVQRQNSSKEGRYDFAEENTMFHDVANVANEDGDDFIDLTMNDDNLLSKMNFDVSHFATVETRQSTPKDDRQEPVSTSNNERVGFLQIPQNTNSINNNRVINSPGYSSKESADTTVHMQTPPSLTQYGDNKRKRSSETNNEFQNKLLTLLTSAVGSRDQPIQKEGQDEDRMFLLSLVSDLKGVPSHRKMSIKAEIVTAIARGQQQ